MRGSRQSSPHLLYAVILAEFVIIAILLGGLSNEYMSNDYYRGWVNSNYPWLGILLQGQLDALLVGMALGATALLIMTIRRDERVERNIQSEPRKIVVGSQPTGSAPLDETDDNIPAISTRDVRADVVSELERQDS
jgi:hypothetical protein